MDELSNLLEIFLLEATRGESWSSQTNASRSQSWHVPGAGVLVAGDVGHVEHMLRLGAFDALRSEVDEAQMVVGSTWADEISVLTCRSRKAKATCGEGVA